MRGSQSERVMALTASGGAAVGVVGLVVAGAADQGRRHQGEGGERAQATWLFFLTSMENDRQPARVMSSTMPSVIGWASRTA